MAVRKTKSKARVAPAVPAVIAFAPGLKDANLIKLTKTFSSAQKLKMAKSFEEWAFELRLNVYLTRPDRMAN